MRKRPQTTVVATRIHDDAIKVLDEMAAQNGETRSQMLARMICFYCYEPDALEQRQYENRMADAYASVIGALGSLNAAIRGLEQVWENIPAKYRDSLAPEHQRFVSAHLSNIGIDIYISPADEKRLTQKKYPVPLLRKPKRES